VATIHHGVDPADFRFNDHPEEFALFLGRISPDKGILEAIQIARAAQVPLMIGAKMSNEDEIGYFRDFVEPLLDDQCCYLGEVNRPEKLELLRRARCLLNPIMWDEPFGMAMIEALACGTPVVARRRGGAIEIVEEGVSGLLGDTDEELVTALKDVGRIDRATCRRYLEQNFSADRMAEEHLALYRRVIATTGGGPISLRIPSGDVPVARQINS
jgi:glycosyltransferase involved in cell wall biosynthesis